MMVLLLMMQLLLLLLMLLLMVEWLDWTRVWHDQLHRWNWQFVAGRWQVCVSNGLTSVSAVLCLHILTDRLEQTLWHWWSVDEWLSLRRMSNALRMLLRVGLR
jgi:hypothetical protein